MTMSSKEKLTEPLLAALQRAGYLRTPYVAYAFPFIREGLTWMIEREKWQGRLIVMPAFVCPVLVEAVLKGGAVPALVDVDPRTWLLDLESVELPWDQVAAVIGVHTLGNPDDIDVLRARVHRVATHACLIEDAAHALGARQDGHVFSWTGDVVLMSLYKQLGYPSGGVVLSRKDWGSSDLTSMAPDLPSRVEAFQEAAAARDALVAPWVAKWPHGSWAALQQPRGKAWRPSWAMLSWELTEVYSGTREEAMRALHEQGVVAERWWWDAPVKSARYRPYIRGACPVSRRLAERVINVPLGTPKLSGEGGLDLPHFSRTLETIEKAFTSLVK